MRVAAPRPSIALSLLENGYQPLQRRRVEALRDCDPTAVHLLHPQPSAAHLCRRRRSNASDRSAQTQPPTALPPPCSGDYNPSRFTHATSPPQKQYSEKVRLLLRVRLSEVLR